MTLHWSTIKGTPYLVILVKLASRVALFRPFCTIQTAVFQWEGHFIRSAPNWPQNEPEHYNVKDAKHDKCAATDIVPGIQFQSVSRYSQAFSNSLLFLEKYTEWPSIDHEQCNVKRTPYILTRKFQFRFTLQLTSLQLSFCDKCTRWPQNGLGDNKVKGRYCIHVHVGTSDPMSPAVVVLRQVYQMTPKWPWRQGQR